MALSDVTLLIKKLTTATDVSPADSPLATAFNGVKDLEGDAKMDFIKQKIVEIGKAQGFPSITVEDVQKYLDSLASQYEINPIVASMMDTYCSTTCHFGTAFGKN